SYKCIAAGQMDKNAEMETVFYRKLHSIFILKVWNGSVIMIGNQQTRIKRESSGVVIFSGAQRGEYHAHQSTRRFAGY
ncbi:MAG: hypothetical protein ABF449_08285, partial [Ethanoligenens sp.]